MRGAPCLAALLIAVSLAAPGPARAGTPRDTLVMAKQIDDIVSLDPAIAFEFSGGEVVGNLYETLLTLDLANPRDPKPGLAQSWSLADDGVTYSFKIADGHKFSSGRAATADDAAFSLQRAVILNGPPGFILTQFGFTPANVAERIRAADPKTLVIQVDKPVAPSFFYDCLMASVASIVDQAEVMAHARDGDLGSGWLKASSAGSGPYRLRAWKPVESYVLEANEAHAGGPPPTRRVTVRHVPEAAAQRQLLEKGDIDVARNLGKDELDALAKVPQIKLQTGLKGRITYVGLNQAVPALRVPEVRQALKYLIDYDGIQKNLLSTTAKVHQTFLPEGFLGAIDDKPFAFDLDRAKALLAQGGYPDGFAVTFDVYAVSPYREIAQAIQESWGRAGIKVDLQQGAQAQVITKVRARQHQVAIGTWGPDYMDPHTNAGQFAMNLDNSDAAKAKSGAWRQDWDIPGYTQRTLAAVAERDSAKRANLYQQLQRDLNQDSPFIFLFQDVEVMALRTDVDGLVIAPISTMNRYDRVVKK